MWNLSQKLWIEDAISAFKCGLSSMSSLLLILLFSVVSCQLGPSTTRRSHSLCHTQSSSTSRASASSIHLLVSGTVCDPLLNFFPAPGESYRRDDETQGLLESSESTIANNIKDSFKV